MSPNPSLKIEAVWRYEAELLSCLVASDQYSVLKLADKAEKNGLFHSKLKDTGSQCTPPTSVQVFNDESAQA